MKKLLSFSLAFCLVIPSASYAQFGGIVHDPVHTYQSALNTAQLIRAEITRLEQLRNQIEQLRNLADLNSWKGKSLQEYNALIGYIGGLKNVYGDIGAQTGRLRKRLDQAAVSNMSYQDYMAQEQQLVKEGHEEAVRRHNDDVRALQKTQEDYQDVQKWEGQVNSGITQMGSSQMMNQQLNKLITQNSEMLKVMVATRMEQREDTLAPEVSRANQLKALRDIQTKRAQSVMTIHEKSKSSLPKSPLEN